MKKFVIAGTALMMATTALAGTDLPSTVPTAVPVMDAPGLIILSAVVSAFAIRNLKSRNNKK